MSKTIVERFLIGGSAHHPSMPSVKLQKAIGSEIWVDIHLQQLSVPTDSGRKIANKGDTIICYSDGTYDVEVKLR